MCGIAGVAGAETPRADLEAMARALQHRGPDDEGFFRSAEAALVFRRLAILDLDGGHQPMENEDGRVQVVFNGEIYNHAALRAELVKAGHRFRTNHSDTEVLVHGWEEWGEDLFPRLNAMFALAIWDERTRTLVLARDRYGIKPLYFAPLPGGIAFASEARALFASGLVSAAPSPSGVLEYFSFQNLWGESTMFEGVRQLDAGSMLLWRDGRTERRRYWDLTFPRRRREKLADLASEHRAILDRVLRRQIQADVPVMSYLSGGIDSTAITLASWKIDPRVTAYSCVFDLDGVGSDRAVDEREYSRLVANEFRLNRVELELSRNSLQDSLARYLAALEEPRMGMGYPVYLIAARVAKDAKVVLSGTGGDEFHAGYIGRYRALGLTGDRPSPLGRLRPLLERGGVLRRRPSVEPAGAYRSLLQFLIRDEEREAALTPAFRKSADFDAGAAIDSVLRACPSDDWRDRVLYTDAKTYLTGLLVLEDKLSMAHGLETRVPLLDNELVDFLLDVPFDTLAKGETGKILFRESVRPWVPAQIHAKPKMGFGPPDASWYRGPLRPWIETMLAPRTVAERGVLRPEYVAGVLEDHFSGRRDLTHVIWSLICFDAWCKTWGFFGG